MSVETLTKEWEELCQEYNSLEDTHSKYLELIELLHGRQQKCFNDIKHQRYRMLQISSSVKQAKKLVENQTELQEIDELEKNIIKREAQLTELEQGLPRQSGFYLRIILGDVNVSILNRQDKIRYKDEYEKFKLALNVIGFVMAVINLFINNRAFEKVVMLTSVWYYCTLTIREAILRVNGSRINGWWSAHHFISTFAVAILLIWPQGEPWQLFRRQFMYFNAFICFVQYLEFGYQKGLLYRLKALGERHNMDITVEGFHSWMWRGMSFLLPFLLVEYLFQAYNAWTLYKLSFHSDAFWHVPVLSFLFAVIFIGNMVSTLMVIPMKLKDRMREKYRLISMGESMKLFKQIKEHVKLEEDMEKDQELNLIKQYRRGRGADRKTSITSKLFWFATLKEEEDVIEEKKKKL